MIEVGPATIIALAVTANSLIWGIVFIQLFKGKL